MDSCDLEALPKECAADVEWASGVAVESLVGFVADFRDGKAIRFRSLLDRRVPRQPPV